jgi:hypothetical protein
LGKKKKWSKVIVSFLLCRDLTKDQTLITPYW